MVTRFCLMLSLALLIGSAAWTAPAQRGFGFPGGGFGPGMGKVVTGEPYTATATSSSVETLANGTTITHNSTITEARDTEGRTYRSVTTPAAGSAPAFTHTTVLDPVAHTITEWSSRSTTATQFQLPTNPPANHGNWAGGTPGGQGPGGQGRFHAQVTRTTLPAQTIAGVNADGVKITTTIPAGAEGNSQPLVSTREVWTATDLKIVLSETSNSPREGSHQLQVTSLTPGAPDSTLFQVPAGYTVKTETRHHGN
jgi:hypothetical protein